MPSALTPVPPQAEPTLDDELRALCSMPADEATLALPRGGLSWFAEAVSGYWYSAMQPYWPAVRAVLQEDLLRRAHLLATKGAQAVVTRLDDRCRWEDNGITVSGASQTGLVHCSKQLVIVTLLFGRGGARCVLGDDGLVGISCQARGATVLENHPIASGRTAAEEPVRGDRLAIVVGRSRAAVLRALVVPTTTSVLAGSLGLSSSTVSEHLSALVAAGVVTRRRLGSRVLYELDGPGVAMLGHLDNETGRTSANVLIRPSPNASTSL
jgi:DNA-binding transcriptional ArsR family regulator